MQLRPYQVQARDAAITAWQSGKRGVLLALATGCGKTEIFLGTLAQERQNGALGRAIILAHRRELVAQPVERMRRSWPQLGEPGIVMGEQNECDAPIIVATVQTLQTPGRIEQILRHGPVTHVVTDEAHHAVAKTYRNVYDELRRAYPELRHLGVTATPKRTDKTGLAKVFDSAPFKMSIRDAIKARALVPFTALGFELPTSFADVPETDESWSPEVAGGLLSAPNVLEIVVARWNEHAADRQTMVFTASVAAAYKTRDAFRDAGIAADCADGTTSIEERQAVIERFRRGEARVLCNCMLWTEGFDLPSISAVAMLAPTRSDLIYVQRAGRGLRLAPGKADCLILDFAPQNARDMVMAGDILGKPRELRKAEQRAREEGVQLIESFGIDADGAMIDDIDPAEIRVRVLDYLASSLYAWTFDGQLATTSADADTILAVTAPNTRRMAAAAEVRARGEWKPAYDQAYRVASGYTAYIIQRGRATMIATTADWDEAKEIAESWADEHASKALAARNRKWRDTPASPKQRALYEHLGLDWEPEMTSGRASQGICHAMAQAALKKVLR